VNVRAQCAVGPSLFPLLVIHSSIESTEVLPILCLGGIQNYQAVQDLLFSTRNYNTTTTMLSIRDVAVVLSFFWQSVWAVTTTVPVDAQWKVQLQDLKRFVCAGCSSFSPSDPAAAAMGLTSAGPNTVLFLANDDDNNSNFDYGRDLWRTDGTVAGTIKLLDVPKLSYPGGSGGKRAILPVPGSWSSSYYFAAASDQYGEELYVATTTTTASNGIVNARLVRDVRPGPSSSHWPICADAWNGRLYFTARHDGSNNNLAAMTNTTLMRSDGTSTGTIALVGATSGGDDIMDNAGGCFHAVPLGLLQLRGSATSSLSTSWSSTLWLHQPSKTTSNVVTATYLYDFAAGSTLDHTSPALSDGYVFLRMPVAGMSTNEQHAMYVTNGTVQGTGLYVDAAKLGSSFTMHGSLLKVSGGGNDVLLVEVDDNDGPYLYAIAGHDKPVTLLLDGSQQQLSSLAFVSGSFGTSALTSGFFLATRTSSGSTGTTTTTELWHTDGTASGTRSVLTLPKSYIKVETVPVGTDGWTYVFADTDLWLINTSSSPPPKRILTGAVERSTSWSSAPLNDLAMVYVGTNDTLMVATIVATTTPATTTLPLLPAATSISSRAEITSSHGGYFSSPVSFAIMTAASTFFFALL
jgi:ELWxxDGT repeat protein